MSDIFSNFEPVEQAPNASSDYSNIKLLHESLHGCSKVFVAVNKGNKVILKALKPEFAQDEQCRQNLRQEYEVTSRLNHKCLRKALAFETVQDLGDCIVLEYIEGKTLAEHVRVGTLDEKEIKTVLIDLCDALNYMHKNGVFHCNLRPENILVTSNDYRVKIIDIGLPETEYKTDRELLIKENEVIAPELIKGEEPDQRSDIYSLGKIIEFIIERNMLSQYKSVATHCTQFSREQRFDSVTEVRSLITKRYSVLKLLLTILILAAIGIAAYVYVPKLVEKSKIEKEERLAVDFEHEVQKVNEQTSSLCEPYRVASLDDVTDIQEAWKADSVKLSQQLARFLEVEKLRPQVLIVIESQKQAVLQIRQHDIDSLMTLKALQNNDSIAQTPNVTL